MLGIYLALIIPALSSATPPQTPAVHENELIRVAKLEAHMGLISDGVKLMGKKKYEDAIHLFRAASKIERDLTKLDAFYFCESKYWTARCYVKLGDDENAVRYFREVFYRTHKNSEIFCGGGYSVSISMQYALTLARRGMLTEAKAMYYLGLRHSNLRGMHSSNLFTPVFDKNPLWIVWKFNRKNLEAAASVFLAQTWYSEEKGFQEEREELLERSQALVPNWFYPALLRSHYAEAGERKTKMLLLAEQLARPGVELQIVLKVKEGGGWNLGSAMSVFWQARLQELRLADPFSTVYLLKTDPKLFEKITILRANETGSRAAPGVRAEPLGWPKDVK